MARTMPSAMRKTWPRFGPESNGLDVSLAEFEHGEFEEGWRYQLVNGVLLVSPPPLEEERDPNGELDYWLRLYRDTHPLGSCMHITLAQQTVKTKRSRRSADRVIWASLGRDPVPDEPPTIVIEFVSKGKRNWKHDYEIKRKEYIAIGVKEYWIIDRFDRTMTVFIGRGRRKKRVFQENDVYTTDLLPGFELRLARLFAIMDWWTKTKGKHQ